VNAARLALAAIVTLGAGCAVTDRAPFQLQEATVASVHAALARGEITCTKLTQLYIERIEAYNLRGPTLRAILTVNPNAMKIAADMDRRYGDGASARGPLHCIPVILKDNFNTFDMPTSAGHVAMKDSVPPADAYSVDRMRRAGALILAKANLQELARGGMSKSSLGGQVLNPYDLTRTPGGSSGGTAVAIASNMAVLGTGSDTGQSIRFPASANNLVGIRPTRGLVSRAGVVPNSLTQDEIGPITRSVRDAALLLNVMAGYDPADPITAFSIGRIPRSYTELLSPDALKGARIGVMMNLFGREARHEDVNRVMEDVIAKVASLGATVIRFDLAEYDKLAPVVATSQYEARTVMERYFAALGPNVPIRSFADLVATKKSVVQKTLENELAVVDGMNSQTYKDRTLNRDKLRLALATKMEDLELDAVLYPLQKILVAPVTAEDQLERNGTLSNGTGFPAVTFPGGFSSPTASAPLGVPVGAEFLGWEYSEAKLLAYAYAFEQAFKPRRPPASTPALPSEP